MQIGSIKKTECLDDWQSNKGGGTVSARDIFITRTPEVGTVSFETECCDCQCPMNRVGHIGAKHNLFHIPVPPLSVSSAVYVCLKLQALVYDILPSTTAVFSYAIGSRKLSANEQFFCCWCSNSSKFDSNNSNKTRRFIYSRQQSLHQHK